MATAQAALATMWTTGKLTPPPPRPIQIPESPACPATHLDEEDDATTQNPSQGSMAFDGSGELQPVSNQCYPREVVELDLETPTRLHSEPWYVKNYDFNPNLDLRPIEIRSFRLLLQPEAPTKEDILNLFSSLPRTHLKRSVSGPFLVSGVSPRSQDTPLTHSKDMPFMCMAINKFMAKQCPSHLYSTFVIRRGGVTHVHRDCRNGPLLSSAVCLTPCHQGDGLWLQDSVGSVERTYRGQTVFGTVFNLNDTVFFDARKRLHAGFVAGESHLASRVTLVTFTSIHAGTLSEFVRSQLLRLGFPIPSPQAIGRALYGPDGMVQPRLRQLTLHEVCNMESTTLDKHDVIEVLDSQETLSA